MGYPRVVAEGVREGLHNKPMHQTGALVLKEFIVFVRSRVSCNAQCSGRPVRSRLQVMGESVRWQRLNVDTHPYTLVSR